MILDRSKQAAPRYENQVRELKLEHGFAIDANDPSKAIPMKLALAVPQDTRQVGEQGTALTMADWKQTRLKEVFEPFLQPAIRYIREQGGRVRFNALGPYLKTLRLNPSWAEVDKMRLPGRRDKGLLKVFVETFPNRFRVDGMYVRLPGVIPATPGVRGATAKPALRMRGKQPMGRTR